MAAAHALRYLLEIAVGFGLGYLIGEWIRGDL